MLSALLLSLRLAADAWVQLVRLAGWRAAASWGAASLSLLAFMSYAKLLSPAAALVVQD